MNSESEARTSNSSSTFHSLVNPQFLSSGQIWHKKEQPLQCSSLPKRFPFYKIGKIFGIMVDRVLAVKDNLLFYYHTQRSEVAKGFCDLTNLYAAFVITYDKNPYHIKLSNYSSTSDLYLNTEAEFNDLKNIIMKLTVQINFDEEFKLKEKVGEGSFAKVYLARKVATGMVYAVKIVRKFDSNDGSTVQSVKNEKMALGLTSSDHCSKLYEFYEDQYHFYFVLEYIPGPSLMHLIKQQTSTLTQSQKIVIIRGILQALEVIHSKQLVNRDIKPQNIIVSKGSYYPKMIDFGLSLLVLPETPIDEFKRCGTMGYIAPEVMKSVEHNRIRYGAKADMFSFGIVVHILLLGVNPLKGKSYEETFEKNKEFDIHLDDKVIGERYGEFCYSFLSRLLEHNPYHRMSAKEALNHPFLKELITKSRGLTIETKDLTTIDFEEEVARFLHQSPRKRRE